MQRVYVVAFWVVLSYLAGAAIGLVIRKSIMF